MASWGELVVGPVGVVAVERVWLVFWPPMHMSAGGGSLVEPRLEVVVAPVEAGWLDVVVVSVVEAGSSRCWSAAA